MDVLPDHLRAARDAHLRRDWGASYAAFVRVDGAGTMALDDLDAYAAAAWRLGHAGEAVRLAERVYDRLARADPTAAARKAAELGLAWRMRGHDAVARGWVDRARVLAGPGRNGATRGYVAYLDAVTAMSADDAHGMLRASDALRDTVIETGDTTLTLLSRVLLGVTALLEARTAEGCLLLDDALMPVVDERVPIEWACDAYRLVLSSGARWADDRHVTAWTTSMQRWCDVTAVAREFVVGPHR